MQNDLATKKDLEHVKNEILQTTKNDIQNAKTEILQTTKEDIQNAKTEILQTTKEDIQNVKNELLAKMVDKEQYQKDMAQLVTKEELKKELSKFTTKDELRFEIGELRKDMKAMDEKHDQRYNRILEFMDGIAGEISNNRIEKVASEATFQRHERKLEDHDMRIGRLEQQNV